MGSSGCGKSTLLRAINRMHELYPDIRVTGEILLDERNIFKMNPMEVRRMAGMVFQRPNPFPTMSIYDNVLAGYILNGIHLSKSQKDEIVERNLRNVCLWDEVKDSLTKRGTFLSGGQQQRVAFARAIVIRPSCTLFDEPLSALDALLREQMRQELKDLVASLGLTAVFVTHDQAEAMSMSSHIAVLNAGTVEQYDTEGIYHRSTTRFVARFVGKSNWLSETELFRPEAASLEEKPGFRRFELPVTGEEYLGESYNVQLQYQDSTWTVHTRHKVPIGEPLSVYIDPTQIIVCKNEKAES